MLSLFLSGFSGIFVKKLVPKKGAENRPKMHNIQIAKRQYSANIQPRRRPHSATKSTIFGHIKRSPKTLNPITKTVT